MRIQNQSNVTNFHCQCQIFGKNDQKVEFQRKYLGIFAVIMSVFVSYSCQKFQNFVWPWCIRHRESLFIKIDSIWRKNSDFWSKMPIIYFSPSSKLIIRNRTFPESLLPPIHLTKLMMESCPIWTTLSQWIGWLKK